MAKQKAFFLSSLEIYQKEHPEAFEKKRRSPSSSGSRPKKEKVYNCETCGLAAKCKQPKIKRYGKGEKGILLVGLCPGRTEDKYGIPFVGAAGSFMKKKLDLFGIDMDRDCIRTNIVQCFPGLNKDMSDKKPTNDQILSCAPRLLKDIEETKPQLIIALGTQAIQSLINTKGLSSFTVAGTHGLCFPNQQHQTWVGCSYHPSFFCRKKKRTDQINDDIIFINDIADILAVQGEPLPKPLSREGNDLITDYKEAIDYIHYIIDEGKPACHDFETNSVSCYIEDPRIFTVSLTNETGSAACIPFDFQENGRTIFTEDQLAKVTLAFQDYLKSDVPKIVQNYYMEELWGRHVLYQPMNNFVHDTIVTAHVLNCRTKTTNLGFQAYQLTGHDYKKMVNTDRLEEDPIEEVACYNNWDTRYTLLSHQDQIRRLAADPELKKFNDWVTGCLPCLANLKHRGMIIEPQILEDLEKQFGSEREGILETILSMAGVREFERREDKKGKPRKFNVDSHVHLNELIYDIWEEPKIRKTKGNKGAVDKEALFDIAENTKNTDVKMFTDSILRYRKCGSMTKRTSQYRKLLDPEDKVHPSFHMNTSATYRSSSSDPNAQNVFNHDEELQVFRKCVVPRPGNLFLEADYSGMEVRGIAMLSEDEELERQLILMDQFEKEHPDKVNPWDTHRRWSARLFQAAVEKVTKLQRYAGKNGFVFPSFYGSIPSSIAKYEDFRLAKILEKHVRQVQEDFWTEYKGVRKWQKKSIEYYNDKGCYLGPMGCKRPGPLSLFQLYNNNIQGLAFHLLLDALQKIDDEMIRRGMQSYAFLEIHDSITFDVVPEEMFEVIDLSTEIMTSKRFDWMRNVPLAVEWEAGTDWYNKSGKYFKELTAV